MDIEDGLPAIKFDRGLMHRAIENILTNADQAMPNGGEINIRSWINQQQLFIGITDSGAGIPADNLEMIFEPLFTTKKNGIGLGLMIVKEILEKHHGEVSVESEEGQGSTFIMQLPAST